MLIESYNVGTRNIRRLFRELLALSRALSDEEQRHVREQLTEDELSVPVIDHRAASSAAPQNC